MIVCIAEKPSVAKEIASVIGASKNATGITRATAIGLLGLSVISARLRNLMNIREAGKAGNSLLFR